MRYEPVATACSFEPKSRREKIMKLQRAGHQIARVAIVGLLATPALAVTSSMAFAAGTSPSTHGCYVQWWNTAWVAKCAPATATSNYSARVDRSGQSDYAGPFREVKKGASATFDSGEALWSVHSKNTYVLSRG